MCPCALLSRNMCSSIVLLSVPVLLMCALYVAGRVHLMRVVGWKNTIRTVLCRRSLFDGRQRLMPDYDRITVALRIPYSVRIQRQSDSTPSSSSSSYSIAVHRMAVMATNERTTVDTHARMRRISGYFVIAWNGNPWSTSSRHRISWR